MEWMATRDHGIRPLQIIDVEAIRFIEEEEALMDRLFLPEEQIGQISSQRSLQAQRVAQSFNQVNLPNS